MFTRSLGVSLAVLVASLLATTTTTTTATAQTQQVPLPQAPRAAGSAELSTFQVTSGTLQDLLSLPTTQVASFQVNVLLGTRLCQLTLNRFDVRAPGFQLIVQDQNGSKVVATPPCVTYRGDVSGYANSIVAASLVGGRLTAQVRLDDSQSVWGVQPVTGSGNGINRFTHITYDSADNVLGKHTCGVQDDEIHAQPVKTWGPMAAQIWVCDLACDADYSFYQKNGSNVTNTQNDITNVVNNVAVIYKRDAGIDYKITTILVRSVPVYTSSGSSVLGEMQNYWVRNHGNVQRDLAHMFTGRGLGGSTIGIAYLGSVCSYNSGYGVSQSRYTSNMTSRTALTAHEIGHGWNATHCNSYSPCNIMCSALGGCSRGLTSFGSHAQGEIVAFRTSKQTQCLSLANSAPVLTGINPSTVAAFPPVNVTLTGSGFTNVTKVNVGSIGVLASQLNILSDTTLTFPTPTPKNLLPVPVNAEISGNTSNSLALYWNPTSPPHLVALSIANPGGTMSWQYGAGPGDLWFLIVGATPSTTSLLGYAWLNNPILITSGQLDGAGLGQFGFSVPNSTALGLKFYSQVVTLNPTQGMFAGNTNLTLTTTGK